MKIDSKGSNSGPIISENDKISRRGLWPLLAGSLLLPILGMGSTKTEKSVSSKNDDSEYITLLKPDGTTVKVKKNTLSSSKIVKKNMSNKSLLKWLSNK